MASGEGFDSWLAIGVHVQILIVGEMGTYVEGAVEGSDQAQGTQAKTDPAANNAECRLVGDLVQRVALSLPGAAETDVGGADGAPNKEVGQTRQGQQPREDGALLGSLADESQETEGDLNHDTPDRTTLAVNIGQKFGSHTALRHGLHSTGRAKGTRVGDGDDGQSDDGVEDGRKHIDTSILNG